MSWPETEPDMIALNPVPARFEPGQLVRHRRYGYRGVIVAVDDSCQADEDWYQKNQTQPDRSQPWHHVLVHGTSTITYAAGENLVADDSGTPIVHPRLRHFFDDFDGTAYERNERPWPT